MTDEKSGLHLRYASARGLQKDHTASFSQGGMLVPWDGAPAQNSTITLRIESPDGTRFDLSARVGPAYGPKGFLVSFEAASTDRARAALDLFMRSDRFRRLVEADKGPGAPPALSPFGALAIVAPEVEDEAEIADEEERTDPGLPLPELDASALSPVEEGTDASPGDGEAGGDEAIDETDPGLAARLESGDIEAEIEPGTLARHLDDDATLASGADGATLASGADEAALEVTPVTEESGESAVDDAVPAGFRRPQPGEEYFVYVVKFALVRDFAKVRDAFRATQRLVLEYKEERATEGKVAQLRLTLPGHNLYTLFGVVEAVTPSTVTLRFDENNESFRQACLYLETPSARSRLKSEEPSGDGKPQVVRIVEVVPEEDPEKMPIRRRLQRMGMDDKINLALSGNREERMALAVDSNKAIHHFLLRNAKISLDEIAFMARLPTMNPDVLDKIAENPGYTQNPTVVKALVYNPKTPVATAIRLLDRLPRSEVMNLAKRVNMNMRLVMAAKKKLESRRG